MIQNQKSIQGTDLYSFIKQISEEMFYTNHGVKGNDNQYTMFSTGRGHHNQLILPDEEYTMTMYKPNISLLNLYQGMTVVSFKFLFISVGIFKCSRS